VFAGDVADAMMACATRLGPGYRTYNVSTGIGTSPEELVRVFRDAGKNIRVHQGPGREDDGHLVLDPSLIRREVEWKPVTGLRTVIEQWV
jgi:nucleoside-diphosphate-sugar epimerase